MRKLLLAVIAAAFAFPAFAQQYPTRPVRVVVGFAPGGGVDISARLLAAKLGEYFGQQFIVENKPGAGTNIAAAEVAKSAPDGYTLFMNSPAVVINTALYAKPPYQLSDFTGVSIFAATTNLLVVPASLPVKNVQELVRMAKEKPGSLNYSSAGQGTTQHLAGELFKLRTGTQIVHVPYKGSGPSMTALLASEVQLTFINPVAAGGHVKAGKLRAVAITSAKRQASMPGVPTVGETIPGYRAEAFQGMVAPAGVPQAIVNKLSAEVARIVHLPEVTQRFQLDGAEAVGSTPKEFTAFLKAEMQKWSKVIKDAGIKPE